MGIMRSTLHKRLFELYNNVEIIYGYITKNTRITNNLEKAHRIDARCISGNPLAKPLENWFYYKKVRCQNRQIHKANHLRGHKKKLNQAPFEVKDFRLFDKVMYENKEYFIFGRRKTGYFDIR
ncbi:MAG: HNH endonuclease, partial [Bacillota bacterium]|nr:HNH endonuclease [Bacillota bacterium]